MDTKVIYAYYKLANGKENPLCSPGGTRLVCDPAYIVGRISLVRLGLVK